MSKHETPQPPPLWKSREYRLWFAGDVLLDLGGGIGNFAFPLIVLAVTGSPAQAGTVGFAQGAAQVLGILPGGLLADRFDRRRLRMLSSALGVLAQVLLIALLFTGLASVWNLASLAFVDRLRACLLAGASDAMMKQVVPDTQLPAAIANNQARNAAVVTAAGPVGGALVAFSLVATPCAQMLGHLGSLLLTAGMRGSYEPREKDVPVAHPLSDLKQGLVWLAQRPVLVRIGVALAFLNFSINGAILAVTLAWAERGVEPALIGSILTIIGVASLVGSLFANKAVEKISTGALVNGVFLVVAVGVVGMAVSPSLLVVALAVACAGAVSPAVNAALMGFSTLIIPHHLMGRVMSGIQMLSMGLAAFAPMVAGWGLSSLGIGGVLAAFSAAALVALAVIATSRLARSIPKSAQWAEYASENGLL